MNIIEQLRKSHERQREMLERCEKDPVAYEEFRSEVLNHVQVRETSVFPALIALDFLAKHVKKAWGRHTELRLHLQKLDALMKDHPEWKQAFVSMKNLHLGRIQEEETTLFPLLRELA